MLAAGTLCNRYRIARIIAEGGMGCVYDAVDERIGRRVALKVVRRHGDPGLTEGQLKEARVLGALNHPNIVQLYDVGVGDDGTSYLAMERIEGMTLRELLREAGALALAPALVMGIQIVDAVRVAHRAGIVHRDLKPENILVMEDGLVKVVDFGIARRLEGSESRDLFPDVATPLYVSPEQANGQPATKASDIYALGAILHEMLAGEHPLVSSREDPPPSRAEVVARHLASMPARLSERLPWLTSTALSEVVARMLAKSPAQRPDAGAVYDALVAECSLCGGGPHSGPLGALRGLVEKRRREGAEGPPGLIVIAPLSTFAEDEDDDDELGPTSPAGIGPMTPGRGATEPSRSPGVPHIGAVTEPMPKAFKPGRVLPFRPPGAPPIPAAPAQAPARDPSLEKTADLPATGAASTAQPPARVPPPAEAPLPPRDAPPADPSPVRSEAGGAATQVSAAQRAARIGEPQRSAPVQGTLRPAGNVQRAVLEGAILIAGMSLGLTIGILVAGAGRSSGEAAAVAAPSAPLTAEASPRLAPSTPPPPSAAPATETAVEAPTQPAATGVADAPALPAAPPEARPTSSRRATPAPPPARSTNPGKKQTKAMFSREMEEPSKSAPVATAPAPAPTPSQRPVPPRPF